MTIEADKQKVEETLIKEKEYFNLGETKNIKFRIDALKKLKTAIKKYEERLLEALAADLHKSEFEAYATEIGYCLDSIEYNIKHLKTWARPKRVRTPIHQFYSQTKVYKEPYGVVLIIGPFNYPFQLLIEPLIGVIASGNCAVLKPSENTPHVAAVINEMILETFEDRYISVLQGGKDTVTVLINSPFDYIFFTGSVSVGRIVMEAAAKNLVPVTLELGGKSPCIVDKTANLETAARRIIWGKLLNAGQTGIAPDYLLVHKDIKQRLLQELAKASEEFYGKNPMESKDYCRIVNGKQFDRLDAMLKRDSGKIVYGGERDRKTLYISPTFIDNCDWSDAVMEEEIFGPILPIMVYSDLDSKIKMIKERPKPLALYLFTEDKRVENKVISEVSFGGGCINDTISHVASPYAGFGGVGNSGIGSYHGIKSFETFTHEKTVLKKSTKINIKLVFPPYKDKIKLVRRVLK